MLSRRAFWVTVIDIALAATAAAAAVILLGARARLLVAGLRITIRSPANLLIATAALAVIRAAVGGRMRFLPGVARQDLSRIFAEREHFARRLPVTRAVLLGGVLTLLGSSIWIVPHVLHPRLVPDPGDPLFSAWRIARIAHQLATDPRRLFDGNIFYPLHLTLTYSDSTFLQALLGTPFVWMGRDPLIVANYLTMIAFPACGVAFFYAAWRLTNDVMAAMVAGLIGAWYPFHAEHYSHLELQWFMFSPLAIVAALRLLADPRVSTGLWLGAAVAAQWLASMYIGVMLVSFLVPFILFVALAWRVRPSRQFLISLAAAVVVAVPAFVGLAAPYLASRPERGERGATEVLQGSALAEDYGKPHIRLVTYQWMGGRGHHAERELFPGSMTLVLAAVGMMPPLTGTTIAAVAAGAMVLDWSLGFNGLGYAPLFKYSPVHRGMRVPARFSVVVGAVLTLLAAFGAGRILRLVKRPGVRALVATILAALVLVDLRMDPRLEAYPATMPSMYQFVKPDMVLVELPDSHMIDYMYFSTRHWATTIGGYSGFIRYSFDAMEGYKSFPSARSIEYFRRAGATHLTYNCAFEEKPWRCDNTLRILDPLPSLEIVAGGIWEGRPVRLYRIK
jgi:hypothetical protein